MRKLRKLDNVMPAVDFDFRHSKYLDPRITFTRASYAPASDPSSGTGTVGGQVQEFNVNVPRLTDKGLLIEETRTNYDVRGTNFTVWNTSLGTNGSITTSGISAPDGSTDACQVTFSDTSANSQINSWVNPPQPNSNITISVWARSVSGTTQFKIGHRPGGSVNWSPDFTATTEWQRFHASFTGVVTDVSFEDRIQAVNTTDIGPIQFWGFQTEQGSFPTSTIPTKTATVTRAADVCEITGDDFSSWYNQGEGSIVLGLSGQTYTPTTLDRLVAFADDNSVAISNYLSGVCFGSHTSVENQRWLVSNASATADYLPLNPNTPTAKTALGFNSTKASSASYDGGSTVQSTQAGNNVPVNLDRLKLFPSMTLAHILYYATRVSDTALQGSTQTGGIRKL